MGSLPGSAKLSCSEVSSTRDQRLTLFGRRPSMTKELLGRNLGFINALKFILIVCTMYTFFTHDWRIVAIIAEPRTLTHQRNLLILKALNIFHMSCLAHMIDCLADLIYA